MQTAFNLAMLIAVVGLFEGLGFLSVGRNIKWATAIVGVITATAALSVMIGTLLASFIL